MMQERGNTIGICTDTTTSIFPEMARELGTRFDIQFITVPTPIRRPPGDYAPDISIGPEFFYRNLKTGPLWETSQANPKDFLSAYKSLLKSGATEIISIHSSLDLTGGINSARAAAEILRDEKAKVEIYPVDSGTVSIGAGLLILEALEDTQKGVKVADTANKLDRIRQDVRLSIAITDAPYLIKSASRRLGLKGRLMAMGAALLDVHPVVAFEGRNLIPQTFVRGQNKLNEALVEQIKKEAQGRKIKRIFVGHTHDFTNAKKLADAINLKISEPKVGDQEIFEAGLALAVYGGEGLRAYAILLRS
jgi:DegV family protein with EDD domain